MNKTFKFLGFISLPFVFITFGLSVSSLLEPTVNWYKAGFFFFLMMANMNTFILYLANRD